MHYTRRGWLGVAAAALAHGAKAPVWRSAALPDVAFEFRLVNDVKEIERLLGDRLDGEFILLEVRLRALFGTEVELDRESFTLRSFRGNERSLAQSPDRIAGNTVYTIGQGVSSSGGVFTQSRENIPVGGGAGQGPPRRVEGMPTGFGGGVGGKSRPGPTAPPDPGEPQDNLRGRLERLELPLAAGDADVSGYLYFQVDPHQNAKHLSLSYDGQYGEFRVSFDK